jgi:hypothetical protein
MIIIIGWRRRNKAKERGWYRDRDIHRDRDRQTKRKLPSYRGKRERQRHKIIIK